MGRGEKGWGGSITGEDRSRGRGKEGKGEVGKGKMEGGERCALSL